MQYLNLFFCFPFHSLPSPPSQSFYLFIFLTKLFEKQLELASGMVELASCKVKIVSKFNPIQCSRNLVIFSPSLFPLYMSTFPPHFSLTSAAKCSLYFTQTPIKTQPKFSTLPRLVNRQNRSQKEGAAP